MHSGSHQLLGKIQWNIYKLTKEAMYSTSTVLYTVL